ncbi:RsmB/NOP family class I SAM-dependent RNA methyltransferase [Candidatus Bathyarchaeota archaeon]|nr:RsmB/NOP family class I SAM-dependent RNA methyltransferase [Candidatus Bathyarchaeota archaeon]
MFGKDFFVGRYLELGWKYEDVEPRQAICANVTNTRGTDVAERLESRGIKLEKIPFLENGYWVCRSRFSVGATSEYLSGLYSIQEAAAQIPVTLFSEIRDKTVLDACAAPGGKTTQLASLMKNTGITVALDVDKRRLTALSNQLERCHVKNTIVYQMDARRVAKLGISFDRILLDVPCSGNFVTDKKWFERRTIEDVKRNAAVQREILAEAVKVLKNDGELIYSTCSLEPEENELNIDWAIRNLELKTIRIECYGQEGLTRVFTQKLDKSIENCKRIWPGQTQGFFVTKLRKRTFAC